MYTCATGFDGYAGQLEGTRARGYVRPPNEQGELGRKVSPAAGLLPGQLRTSARMYGARLLAHASGACMLASCWTDASMLNSCTQGCELMLL